MLGLVYLTGVAGLIATSAVIHQLSLSRGGQFLLPPGEISPTHFSTSNLSPETSSPTRRLPCCVLANKSLNPQTGALGSRQHHSQIAQSSSAQTSILCLWGSLLASMGHKHPETQPDLEASQTWSPVSLICPDCLATLPPLECGLRNTSSVLIHGPLENHRHHSSWLSSSLFGAAKPSLDSDLEIFPPVHLQPCHLESVLSVDKVQALLMPG